LTVAVLPTSRRRSIRSVRSSAGAIGVYVLLLFCIPAQLVFAPLGAAGTPAQMCGIALFVIWTARRLARLRPQKRIVKPIHCALFVFALTVLASYVVATTRAVAGIELRAADRGLLSLCAWAGVVLVATDGVSRDQLDRLLRTLSWAAGGLAALGVLQFFTGLDITKYVVIPGLSANTDYASVTSRADFVRPAGTATHPIEFGVVLAMCLPIAIHYALDGNVRQWRRWTPVKPWRQWIPVALIAFALPVSISRSAVVGTVIVLLFLLPSWPTPRRRRAYAAVFVVVGMIYLAIPGLLGTLRNLFTGFLSDSSTQSRTGSYSVAGEYIAERPLFGRGFGTFLPSFHILDNQFLIMLISTGIVGALAFLGLFLTGIFTARAVRRRSEVPSTRGLAQSLAASVAVGAASSATFDSLSFPMAAGTIFLVLGCVGALWRLQAAGLDRNPLADEAELL
jgi:polysaccharide biosynthesis protein PslJ